ncbi:MAG: hypothetical protein ACQERK_02065 [Campylobacterota bacterium]
MRTLLVIALGALFFLGGCATKKQYEPEDTHGAITESSCPEITAVHAGGATLDDGTAIDTGGNTKALKKGYQFVGSAKDTLIQADDSGSVFVGDQEVTLDDRVISAAAYEDKLAFITAQNRYGVYDLAEETMVFQDVGSEINAINTKTVAPLKIDDLLIFATLEGELIVTDGSKILREITVTPANDFSNIIYMGVLNNTLIAATATDILALGQDRVFRESYKVADIVKDDDYLYLFTKDGRIVQLDENLKEIKTGNFLFANFVDATLIKGNIYAVEKAGYMLQFNSDLNYKVYDIDAIDSLSFFTDQTFYHGGRCFNP